MYIEKNKIVKLDERNEYAHQNIIRYDVSEIKLFNIILRTKKTFYSTSDYKDVINKNNFNRARTPKEFFENIWDGYPSKNHYCCKNNTIYRKCRLIIKVKNDDNIVIPFNSKEEMHKYTESLVQLINDTVDQNQFIKI